mgnify:CR=1 FL=1
MRNIKPRQALGNGSNRTHSDRPLASSPAERSAHPEAEIAVNSESSNSSFAVLLRKCSIVELTVCEKSSGMNIKHPD